MIGRPKANAGSGRGRPPASNGDLIRDGTRVDETGLHMAPEPRHHRRNTGPMLASPRCGARTRSGQPCRAPAVREKRYVACMAARPAPARPREIRTRSSTAALPAKPLQEIGRRDDGCGRQYDCSGNSPEAGFQTTDRGGVEFTCGEPGVFEPSLSPHP